MNVDIVYFIICIFKLVDANGSRIQPNIVLVVADDLGWNDVGFTTKDTLPNSIPETLNLDRLAGDGLVLNNFYVQALCTPTRAALLSGKYPHKVGLLYSYTVIAPRTGPNDGLGTQHKLFTEELSDKDYRVHGVGKWHLGSLKEHLPVNRGFDSFYGAYTGMINHYSHKLPKVKFANSSSMVTKYEGYDLHYDYKNGNDVVYTDIGAQVDGIHSTDLFTAAAVDIINVHDVGDPLFLYVAYTAPHSELQPKDEIVKTRNAHIKDGKRREYAAMVTQMDDGIGEIVSALKERNMWDNTFFIFLSDHGACKVANCWDNIGGSNSPYRDGKGAMFEGGIKSAALLWSPWLPDSVRGTASHALLHVVDLYPLFLDLADDTIRGSLFTETEEQCTSKDCAERDGGSFFRNILNGNDTGRDTILHNIVSAVPEQYKFNYCTEENTLPDDYAVVRHKHYKLFMGLQDWCRSSLPSDPCPEQVLFNDTTERYHGNTVMLFDLQLDPYETVNIAAERLDVVAELRNIILENSRDAVDYWT